MILRFKWQVYRSLHTLVILINFNNRIESTESNEDEEPKPKRVLVSNGVHLSKSEWATWYHTIGEIERGMWVPSHAGTMYMPVNDKIILTGGTYSKPIVKKVFVFDSSESVEEFLRMNFGGT